MNQTIAMGRSIGGARPVPRKTRYASSGPLNYDLAKPHQSMDYSNTTRRSIYKKRPQKRKKIRKALDSVTSWGRTSLSKDMILSYNLPKSGKIALFKDRKTEGQKPASPSPPEAE